MLSASNKLAGHYEDMDLPNKQPAHSISKDPYEEEMTTFGYAVVEVKDVRNFNYMCNIIHGISNELLITHIIIKLLACICEAVFVKLQSTAANFT